jgi:hypothetical protein
MLLFAPLSGCKTYPPSIHNDEEALAFAREELEGFCSTRKCTPEEFDAPVKIEDMSSYDPKYDWFIQFSRSDNSAIGVFFVISEYKERKISFMLEADYLQRKKEKEKDRKENPWKYIHDAPKKYTPEELKRIKETHAMIKELENNEK